MYSLYGILDTKDFKTRYIGYTKSKLEKRLQEHWHASYFRREKNCHRCKWLRSIYDKKLEVKIYVIRTSDSLEEIKDLEKKYIKISKKYRKLTNNTIGGDGTSGLKWSEESRKKNSLNKKGILRPDKRFQVFAENIKTGEIKTFLDKTEAAKYIGCKENAIASVSCGIRKKVYNWKVKFIQKGAQ